MAERLARGEQPHDISSQLLDVCLASDPREARGIGCDNMTAAVSPLPSACTVARPPRAPCCLAAAFAAACAAAGPAAWAGKCRGAPAAWPPLMHTNPAAPQRQPRRAVRPASRRLLCSSRASPSAAAAAPAACMRRARQPMAAAPRRAATPGMATMRRCGRRRPNPRGGRGHLLLQQPGHEVAAHGCGGRCGAPHVPRSLSQPSLLLARTLLLCSSHLLSRSHPAVCCWSFSALPLLGGLYKPPLSMALLPLALCLPPFKAHALYRSVARPALPACAPLLAPLETAAQARRAGCMAAASPACLVVCPCSRCVLQPPCCHLPQFKPCPTCDAHPARPGDLQLFLPASGIPCHVHRISFAAGLLQGGGRGGLPGPACTMPASWVVDCRMRGLQQPGDGCHHLCEFTTSRGGCSGGGENRSERSKHHGN